MKSDIHVIPKTPRQEAQINSRAQAVCTQVGGHQEILAEARAHEAHQGYYEALEARQDKGVIMAIAYCRECCMDVDIVHEAGDAPRVPELLRLFTDGGRAFFMYFDPAFMRFNDAGI